ncbi:MAG: Tat pathway signal protein [Bacteroidota bacterium]
MITSIKASFKAGNGKYLSVARGTGLLQATSDTLGDTEKFQITYHGGNIITIIASSNGNYVSNQQNGAAPLAAVMASVTETEKFVMCEWGKDDKIVLLASNQKYIQLVQSSNVLQALTITDNLSDSNTFKVVPLDQNGVPVTFTHNRIATAGVAESFRLNTVENPTVYTVCFTGTGCTRDEGEVTRPDSNKNIYCPKTGYIPVRIHKEISGSLTAVTPSVTIRGAGENDWAVPRNNSEPLQLNGPLNANSYLLDDAKKYSGGDQYSTKAQMDGLSGAALALHAANLAASSGKQQYNFIGHSRGGMECIMAAWFIFLYGPDNVKNIPINIFAIDPVPGPGEWYGIFTQLPPNVVNYVGVYAWDMCKQPLDKPYMALVPRPNGPMTGKGNSFTPYVAYFPWNQWKSEADNSQLTDPLEKGTAPQPQKYELYACRGRHSTVAGNSTSDSGYVAANVSETVAPVPELIYKMARGYLTKWGTVFPTSSAVQDRVLDLRQRINTIHREFDTMGGGETRTSALTLRPYVRRVSSISGSNPFGSYYWDNAAGDPPYKMAYPVTSERTDTGWVKWKFL